MNFALPQPPCYPGIGCNGTGYALVDGVKQPCTCPIGQSIHTCRTYGLETIGTQKHLRQCTLDAGHKSPHKHGDFTWTDS